MADPDADVVPEAVAVGYHLGECATTQPLARAWAGSALDPSSVAVAVLADRQTAGMGREGRRWVDGPGDNLALSVGVRGPLQAAVLDGAMDRIVRAVRAVVADLCAVRADIVAPNDLELGGRKVGGVLIDARTVRNVVQELVIGVGLNISGADFEVEGRGATTIEVAGGNVPPARELADAIAPELLDALDVTVGRVRWRQPARLWMALSDQAPSSGS